MSRSRRTPRGFKDNQLPSLATQTNVIEMKGCGRCGTGDLSLEADYYGWYMRCVQCGRHDYLDERQEEIAKLLVIKPQHLLKV